MAIVTATVLVVGGAVLSVCLTINLPTTIAWAIVTSAVGIGFSLVLIADLVTAWRRQMKPRSRQPFRFRLIWLFVLLAIVGVVSGVLRAVAQGDPTVLLGVSAFSYGGILGGIIYAFVASLMVLTTTTLRGQRAGQIFAAAVGAVAWIAFIVGMLYRWPQLCVLQGLIVSGIAVWVVRSNWNEEQGPSPEKSLARLIEVKRQCASAMANRARDENGRVES